MKEEKTPQKIVKGGFRATLALIIAIIALILAGVAFNRSGGQADLKTEIQNLQQKMEKMKQETTERVSKIKDETAKAIKKMGVDLKKDEENPTQPKSE